MSDPNEALARRVLADNLRVKRGESVVVESWTHSLPMAAAFAREARRLGARPTVLYEDETAWWSAVDAKQTAVLGDLSDAERGLLRAADVFIYLWGPEDRPRMSRLPDAVQDRLTGWNEEWYRIARKSGVRGCRMSVAQASDAEAERFGLDGSEWRRRLVEAGLADARSMYGRGQAFVRKLERASELTVRHPNGTDVTLQLDGVHARVETGLVDATALKRPYGMLTNSPSGQVLVAVDRARPTGTVVSNRTVYLGPERYGEITWKFEEGRLVDHIIGEGRERFERQFAAAPKGRELLGYFSLGLNPAARDLPPAEDTEEGAVLFGIGRNTMAGGKIAVPFLGYALVGEATVELDGTPVARGGRLVG